MKLLVLNLFISFITLVVCQTSDVSIHTTSPSAASSTSTTSGTQPTATVDPQQPSASNDTEVIEEPAPVACTPGISVGYMLIWQPNITSIVNVGRKYNVSWEYTKTVNKPPSFLDVYVQNLATAVTWKNRIAQNIPTEPRWFWWTPVGLADGRYKIRLVPDGKETFNVKANEQPCFSNGESIPSVSAVFNVVNPKGPLGEYPESFPANSGAADSKSISRWQFWLGIVIGAFVAYLWE